MTAEHVRHLLAELEDQEGRLTPEVVVEAARRKTSPLHDCFEWDDSTAAHAWRLEQARGLIRSVRLQITVDHKEVSTVHYVRDPRVPGEEQGYVSIEKAQHDGDLAEQIIGQEFGRADAALSRAQEIARALKVKRVIEGARKHLAAAAVKVEKHMGHAVGA